VETPEIDLTFDKNSSSGANFDSLHAPNVAASILAGE
jgi:hypothetical protein